MEEGKGIGTDLRSLEEGPEDATDLHAAYARAWGAQRMLKYDVGGRRSDPYTVKETGAGSAEEDPHWSGFPTLG